MKLSLILWLSVSFSLVADPMQVASTWSSITLNTGRVIQGVTITGVDTHCVQYMTATGCGSVELSDLPVNDQKALGYDPTAAAKALAAERQREAATDALIQKVTAQEQAATGQTHLQNAVNAQPALPTLSADQVAQIQGQIVSLQGDIQFMQLQENKQGGDFSKGAYPQKIMDEKAQILKLQSQLH